MKKVICFLLGFILTTSFVTALAAEVPVAEIYSTGGQTAVILSETGSLVFSLNIDTDEKVFVTDNVEKAYDTGGFINVIKKDGSYELYDVRWHGECNFVKSLKGDYKDFLNVQTQDGQLKEVLLMDKDNNLVLLYGGSDSEEYKEKIVLSNVKAYVNNNDTTFNYGISGYAITLDNVLYSVLLNGYEAKFIMSEVDSYYYGQFGSSCVLKTNGDVYILSESPSKLLSNVRLDNGVVQGCRKCAFITNDNKLYLSDLWDPDFPKTDFLGDNFNKLSFDGTDLFAINKTGDLFRMDGGSLTQIDLDGYKMSDILNGRYINDWGYYIYEQGGKYTAIEKIGVIKDVVKVGNCTVFINSEGEVWKEAWVLIDYANFYRTGLSDKVTKLLLNGDVLQLTQKLQNVSGRTMYPFRECLEAMGATVMWDGENRIAIGEIPGIKIEFPIGKSEYYINGTKYEMDISAYVDESIGRTYIPLRYAAEGLGFTVDWIPGDIENTISVHK